ncbi:MAG: MmcQ/YjbR family DNA-binding protein [Saprospiraceae bacterium]|nr:MmcQ/YjbR family DNA-binding protein [Saprospiraceae bacterium]
MNIEALRNYCLSKKAVEETFPFGEQTLVFKVLGKMFALTGLDELDCSVNLKCKPEWAIELREEHPEDILPGYHMNKQHWNTVKCEAGLDDKFIKQLIDHSYDLVVASLPKKIREELQNL